MAAETESVLLAPGESPFRIKGLAYRGHMAYAEAHVPGGIPAMLDGLDDPRLRAFFEQPFLTGSWYDLLPLLPTGRVCARLLGKPYAKYLADRTRWQAEQDIGGVHKFLLRLVSPESLAARLPRLLQQYFDFGATEAQSPERGRVGVASRGFPRVVLPWMKPVCETYTQVVLELRGAKNVRVRFDPPETEGTVAGLEVVRFAWDIRWD